MSSRDSAMLVPISASSGRAQSVSSDDLNGSRGESRLSLKDDLIARLRESNRGLEGALLAEQDRSFVLKKDTVRLQRKHRQQDYLGRMLRKETAGKLVLAKKLESMNNVLEWGDVSRRHDVEDTLRTKTSEIEHLNARLVGSILVARTLQFDSGPSAAACVPPVYLTERGDQAKVEQQYASERSKSRCSTTPPPRRLG